MKQYKLAIHSATHSVCYSKTVFSYRAVIMIDWKKFRVHSIGTKLVADLNAVQTAVNERTKLRASFVTNHPEHISKVNCLMP